MTRRTAAAAVLAACAIAGAEPAAAHDSLSPAGAPHHWLPKEDWVYRHWIPFDQGTLEARLGLAGRQLEGYLYNDHRSLDTLAAARGVQLTALEDALLEPWAGLVESGRMAVLRDHTHRILTQPHLAQHLFFHVLHGIDARAHARELFGVSPRRYWRMRLRGASGRRIARTGGVSLARSREGMARLFAEDRAEGVRLQLALPVAAELMERARLAQLDCWLARPLPTFDPLNYYAHVREQHGHHHARGYPAGAAERRADDRRVEAYRKSRPNSCHPRPTTWPPRPG